MTRAQLDAVVARTGHDRLLSLTADSNPDVGQRDAFRRLVAQLADPSSTPSTPQPAGPPRPDAPTPAASRGGCCPPEPPFAE